MIQYKKILMTLALLLTAVTGAWAKTDANTVEWTYETWAGWAENVTTHTVGDITITATGSGKVYQSTSSGEPLALQAGNYDAITFTSNGKPFASISIKTPVETQVTGWTYNSSTFSCEWSGEPTTSVTLSGCDIKADEITFTFGTAEPPIVVEPGSSANTWTFTQPGGDVVLTPIYAKAAAFATTGTEPEVKTLLPEAAEGVIAGTDAPLIAEGTGIVAFAGTSTEVTQGTVMYAVTPTSVTDASELIPSDWKNTVPTAKNIADNGAEVKVWYYIQGADTPDGETPTADNTFNDSEICTTPLTVTVRSNKFDLAFKAANANTIDATQASKGTVSVKVGDAEAEDKTEDIAEGKLKAIKMGSEVKLNAKQGYKFRKVEVKKAAAAVPAKPEYADNAEELPANTKLYMRADLVYNGDWLWIPTYTAEQAQAVANYYAAITGTKCAVIYGHGTETDIYYVTSDNGVSGTVYRSNNLTDTFPGYKVYLLK